ncbi:uncharacterized protein LOC129950995 [Eupeodes corollae]|uniref:uncharacterized protein LOC129950995 n=1 Tax=Eupeodes corollae TaxID=290404 RepID=UPI00248F9D13|nr:uncharacterized protein LOC129950995 [Eupeodes corollae]
MTTSYHPQANGIVERFHRTLKAAINCNDSNRWVQRLPLILLGLRATLKEDLKATPAELVYGTSLRLPADLLAPTIVNQSQCEFVKDLRRMMRQIKPQQTAWHTEQQPFVHQDLKSSTHVFVRNDSVKASIVPPYEGPYKVLGRSDKYFTLDIRGKQIKLSIDRLKPAYLEADEDTGTGGAQEPSSSSSPSPEPPQIITTQPYHTSRGCCVRIPGRYT